MPNWPFFNPAMGKNGTRKICLNTHRQAEAEEKLAKLLGDRTAQILLREILRLLWVLNQAYTRPNCLARGSLCHRPLLF